MDRRSKERENTNFESQAGQSTAQYTRCDITNIATQPAYTKLHLSRSAMSSQPAVDQETKKERALRSFVRKCGETLFVLDQQAVSDIAQDPFRNAAFDKRSLSTR